MGRVAGVDLMPAKRSPAELAASLLNAIHLPELITSTQEEYEQVAIALATDPGRLAGIGQKLEANRLTTPTVRHRFVCQTH